MGTLLAELASREILTGMTVKRLREYISNKYPHLSPALRAGIFADAVNRIVAGKLPELPKDRVSLFRAFLYGDAAKKQAFSIDCSDIFKSSLKLKTEDEQFVKGLAVWLEESLLSPVSEEKVFEYVRNACRMLEETPDADIEKVLETIESSVGDIRPKKRLISLIRMNPAAGGAMQETQKEAENDTGRKHGDKKYVRGEDLGVEAVGKEGAGQDWIVIRERASAGEIADDRISRLRPAAWFAGICRRVAGIAAKAASKGSGYRIAAISGLIAAALMCTFLLAVYVNGVVKAEQTKADDILKPEDTAVVADDVTAAAAAAGGEGESRGEVLRMRATAYDLSVESCGKERGHPEYGITYSGTRAEAGRTVAVDPEVIPLGSSVRITFPEEYSHMDGMYVAEDTGRLIRGNSIDIFFGEDEIGSREVNKKALKFGVQYVEVEIIDNKQALR